MSDLKRFKNATDSKQSSGFFVEVREWTEEVQDTNKFVFGAARCDQNVLSRMEP